MNKTAWTISDALAYLKRIGIVNVEPSDMIPKYVGKLIVPRVYHWCMPCWEVSVINCKKYLRMDGGGFLEILTPDSVLTIQPNQGIYLEKEKLFRFLQYDAHDGYNWEDIKDPEQVNGRFWEEMIVPDLSA